MVKRRMDIMRTICGLDCGACPMKGQCAGCAESHGRPFGGSCVLALCCEKKTCENYGKVFESPCRLKQQLIAEFNALRIPDMPQATELHALRGAFVNLSYSLPSGQQIRFWDDDRIYLGNQLEKKNGDRCYGLTADENHLLVCEYGENGSDPEIIVYQKRR